MNKIDAINKIQGIDAINLVILLLVYQKNRTAVLSESAYNINGSDYSKWILISQFNYH